MHIEDDTYVEGSLHVAGNVMGSGPYLDSSDSRFKVDVRPLDEAADKATAGVTRDSGRARDSRVHSQTHSHGKDEVTENNMVRNFTPQI